MIQPVRTYSPYAPPGLAGLPNLSDGSSEYVDKPHTFVFYYNGVPAGGTVTGLFQSFDADADFFWRATMASCPAAETQEWNRLFAVRFQDPNGIYLSDDFVGGFGLSTYFANQPTPQIPGLHCPAGSRILIDLQDQSGLGTDVLLNFIGVKRYYLS